MGSVDFGFRQVGPFGLALWSRAVGRIGSAFFVCVAWCLLSASCALCAWKAESDMSIFAYTGLPGSGKSYTVVEQQAIPAL